MRTRHWSSGLAAVLLTTAGPASAAEDGGTPPDPAPGGPQRPYEPDVSGPRNIDSLKVQVGGDGGAGVRVAFDRTSRAEPTGPPAAPRRFVFLFDEALDFHPKDFPLCARTVIETNGPAACPAGSRIGHGTSHLYPEGTAEVHAFNTRHPNGLRGALVVIPASNTVLELTWEKVTHPYRERGYRWALDEIVPPSQMPPEQRVGTRRFELTWGATRDTASFATVRKNDDKLRFGLWSEFVTGQIVLPETVDTVQ
ncbi:hypothetical protein OG800_12525 [Streptomyces sp. NBC_00445]|uniref:hypothetical protein n=1 Tax=unclassified Streptomyces TaxID=2593676 RepID=UPI002E1B066A|nr:MULTISPECIES: hypothetical protein [unclassified Streptomyces]